MDPVNIIVWIIIGAVAGWLASIVMRTNRRQGLIEDIVIGIVGGLLGGFILEALGTDAAVTGLNFVSLLTAFVGAVILIGLLKVARRA